MSRERTGLTCCLAIVAAACSGPAASPGDADLVLPNASVVTMDAGRSIANAVAIRGDRIVAVGAADDEAILHMADKVVLTMVGGRTAYRRGR